MRLRAPLAVAVTTLILGASTAVADPTGRYVYVAPTAGFTLFDGRIKYPTQPLKDGAYWGARVGVPVWSWMSVEGAGGMTSTHELAPNGQDVGFFHVSGNLVFSHFGGLLGAPFLSLGGGFSRLSPEDPNALLNVPDAVPGDVDQGNAEIALGYNFWMTDKWGLRLEGRQLMWLPHEDWLEFKPITRTGIASVSLAYAFGSKPRDTDADGVPDRADKCSATPHGATVDATGCPHDTDGDGVLDGLDQCADTPTGCTIELHGCPTDADGDGVCDGIDKCANTPKGATVDSSGCTSDSDGDGVLDGLDQCASTPKGATVDANGCPVDSDADGVPDGLDLCAGTSIGIPVDSTGCPIGFREREQELMDTGMIRLNNVQFSTGKADLVPASFAALDAVGDLLVHWPQLKIEVAGHTDSKGSKKLNDKLSQSRADSVRAYLLKRFPQIQPDQFVAKGYGPSKPVASNDTEAGRTLNRRVEFKVLNQGVLMQEVERRNKPATPDSSATPSPAPSETAPPQSPTPPPPPAPTTPPPAPPAPSPAPADTTKTPEGTKP